MRNGSDALPWMALLAAVAAAHLSLLPRVADLDGFYHMGHALAYLEGSLLDTSLPWATQSVIGDVGGDLWWGFHVLLLPFAGLAGVEVGTRLAAALLTLALASTVFLVLRRHGVPGAGWWAALFLLAVPNVLFRHLMLRPHVLSLTASFALLSVLVRGRWWQVGLLSAFIAWIHLSLSWMGPALVAAYAVVRVPVTVAVGRDRPDRGVPLRAAVPASVGGALLGWLLRPDPLATATLLNTQLVELFTVKALDVPLTFAVELTPVGPVELARTSGLFLLVWLAVVGVVTARGLLALKAAEIPSLLDRLGQERSTFALTALATSAVFLALALLSARRAMVQWVGFASLAIPVLWSGWRAAAGMDARDRREEGGGAAARTASTPMRLLRVGGVTLLALHLAWVGWRHHLNVQQVAFDDAGFQEVAGFLEERSDPGDIVFHARWDNFGPLFAYNRSNRYLGGMDPIFLYAHDPRSYWEFFYLSAEVSTDVTCDAYPCEAGGVITDTHRVLTEHFGARWVVVEPFRNPLFSLYLLNDPRYEVALETQSEALFEILPPSATGEDAP